MIGKLFFYNFLCWKFTSYDCAMLDLPPKRDVLLTLLTWELPICQGANPPCKSGSSVHDRSKKIGLPTLGDLAADQISQVPQTPTLSICAIFSTFLEFRLEELRKMHTNQKLFFSFLIPLFACPKII